MSLEKMIQAASDDVGYLEKKSNSNLDNKTANAGYNNYTKFGAWYDGGSLQGQPWCDMSVSYWGDKAGESDTVGCYAYCPSHVNFFKRKNQWFKRGAKTPQRGDIIFFSTDGSTACHVGLVEKVPGGYVYTIEGNTSGGSGLEPNGGGVFRKSYALTSTYILGYGRPAYKEDAKTYTLGWHRDGQGWWYAYSTTEYYKATWAKLDGRWYYFDADGYTVTSKAVEYNGNLYYLTETGNMQISGTVELDGIIYNVAADGKLTKAPAKEPEHEETEDDEMRYSKISDVTYDVYRETLDKLISKGILKGREGSGEDLVIDLSDDSVRLLVMLDRAGVFGD